MDVGAGLYVYDVVVKKFTFAISSADEFLYNVYNKDMDKEVLTSSVKTRWVELSWDPSPIGVQ